MSKLSSPPKRLSQAPINLSRPPDPERRGRYQEGPEWRKWYSTKDWKVLRCTALKRDGFICRMCGSSLRKIITKGETMFGNIKYDALFGKVITIQAKLTNLSDRISRIEAQGIDRSREHKPFEVIPPISQFRDELILGRFKKEDAGVIARCLSVGRIDVDDYRSITENHPLLSDQIISRLSTVLRRPVSRQDIFKLCKAGAIKGGVVTALLTGSHVAFMQTSDGEAAKPVKEAAPEKEKPLPWWFDVNPESRVYLPKDVFDTLTIRGKKDGCEVRMGDHVLNRPRSNTLTVHCGDGRELTVFPDGSFVYTT